MPSFLPYGKAEGLQFLLCQGFAVFYYGFTLGRRGLLVLLLSFFIRDSWMVSTNESIVGWTLWQQLLVQIKGMGATIALTAIGTLVICFVIDKTMGLRIDELGEIEGLDRSLHRENGYGLICPESR